jgi:hypothetical protein
MTDFLLGGAIGGLLAFVFAIPALVLEIVERGRVPNLPLLVDIREFVGAKLSPMGVFLAGLLLHIVIGFLFGFIYPIFVIKGWLVFTNAPYTFLSLLIYAVGAWIVAGTIVFPALGLGWFGRRQGKRVWMEILASMLLIGIGMWLLVKYYQPVFFSAVA